MSLSGAGQEAALADVGRQVAGVFERQVRVYGKMYAALVRSEGFEANVRQGVTAASKVM